MIVPTFSGTPCIDTNCNGTSVKLYLLKFFMVNTTQYCLLLRVYADYVHVLNDSAVPEMAESKLNKVTNYRTHHSWHVNLAQKITYQF